MKSKHDVLVLIIDDEIHMLHLLARMLSSYGFQTVQIQKAREALERLESGEISPDVITCDISMPDINGFEFLQHIKKIEHLAHIPIIMLTAMGQMSEAGRAKDMGAAEYLTKPFSASTLVESIKGLLSDDKAKLMDAERMWD